MNKQTIGFENSSDVSFVSMRCILIFCGTPESVMPLITCGGKWANLGYSECTRVLH
jgi:hypothetical protein